MHVTVKNVQCMGHSHIQDVYISATCNCVMYTHIYVMFVCVHVQPMRAPTPLVGKDCNRVSMGKANQMAA